MCWRREERKGWKCRIKPIRVYLALWLGMDQALQTCVKSCEPYQFTHTICGKVVCLKAFLKATTVSRSQYFEVCVQFLQGHFQLPSTRFRMSTEMAMQWLKLFACENGDKLPDHNKILLLPSSLTKTAVHDQYSAEYPSSRYEYVDKHVYDFLNLTVYYC